MYHLHIRIPKETHDRLIEETIKNPKAKNKSEHARLLLKTALGATNKETGAPASDGRVEKSIEALRMLVERVLEKIHFLELALAELLEKRSGAVEELRQREKSDERSDSRPRTATLPPVPKPQSTVHDPRKMTKDERAAWKRQLARELTEEET